MRPGLPDTSDGQWQANFVLAEQVRSGRSTAVLWSLGGFELTAAPSRFARTAPSGLPASAFHGFRETAAPSRYSGSGQRSALFN